MYANILSNTILSCKKNIKILVLEGFPKRKVDSHKLDEGYLLDNIRM